MVVVLRWRRRSSRNRSKSENSGSGSWNESGVRAVFVKAEAGAEVKGGGRIRGETCGQQTFLHCHVVCTI